MTLFLSTFEGRYPEVWSGMPVAVVGDPATTVTYQQALANWLLGQGPSSAMDDPNIKNPRCPF